MAETLPYYTLEPERDAYNNIDRRENPELRFAYTSSEAARAAGDVVLNRILDGWRAKLAARNPVIEPDAVKRAWDSEKKAACYTDTRIKSADIRWEEGRDWTGALIIHCETRHRWREVQMRMEVAKNGTANLTYALGKALPWTKWGYGDGGLYVPSRVALIVSATLLPFAATRDELAAWVRGGEGATDV